MRRNRVGPRLALVGLALAVTAKVALGGTASVLTATPFCHATDELLAVHTILEIEYIFSGAAAHLGPKKSRALWNLSCHTGSRECVAVVIDLDDVDKGKPLTVNDVTAAQGVKIVSQTAKTFVIQWGRWRTLTVDLATKRVEYRESGPTTEGRGAGPCG